jgi:beta-xylosidase
MTFGTRPLATLLTLAIALGACSNGSGNDGASGSGGVSSRDPAATLPPESGSAGASAAPSADPSTAAEPAEGEFKNPVLDRYFADPFVLEVDGTYYAYATGNLTYNLQVSTSTDLVEWSRPKEALARLPLWQPSSKGLTWAPEVIETPAGFVMHYTGRDVQEGKQCLAVAVADSPEGPFVDESEEPLLCQYDEGGSIDSSPFVDEDGKLYLLWKNDGNCCGLPTRIYMQEMSEDGLELVGEARDIGARNDAGWERDLVEAPTLLLHEGTYYLFFSANGYNTRNYAVGYATSDELFGPYEDAPENPILKTEAAVGTPRGEAAGPGHQSVIADDDGDLWMVYHAWDVALVGDPLGGTRTLWIDELIIEDGKARVEGPDAGPQPIP